MSILFHNTCLVDAIIQRVASQRNQCLPKRGHSGDESLTAGIRALNTELNDGRKESLSVAEKVNIGGVHFIDGEG